MNIGAIIKNARRKNNMTQEQMAEYLNVSISAISQWESDKTSPDISIIPSICNLLNISADELLGVNILKKQEKIKEIDKEAMEYIVIGKNEEAIKILRRGLTEFPNSYELMVQLQHALHSYGMSKDKNDEVLDEVIAIGEKVLNECTEDYLRHNVIHILCYVYPQEKAVKLAETMPTLELTSESLLATIYKDGDKRFERRRHYAIRLISNAIFELHRINTQLDNGSWAYTIDEEISICKKSLSLLDILFENGDFGEYIIDVNNINYQLSRLYCKKKDVENALLCLERLIKDTVSFDTEYDRNTKHTSLLFRNEAYDGFGFNDTENQSYTLVKWIDNQKDFDIIRDTDKFKELYAKLKEVASENRDFDRYRPI